MRIVVQGDKSLRILDRALRLSSQSDLRQVLLLFIGMHRNAKNMAAKFKGGAKFKNVNINIKISFQYCKLHHELDRRN